MPESEKSKIIRLTSEELARVKAIPARLQQITLQLGQIEIEHTNLERRLAELDVMKENLLTDLVTLQQQERAVSGDLVSRYGIGTLDPVTGIFVPQEK